MELKKTMTLVNGCTVIVGSIIGSGIFVSPSGVLRVRPPSTSPPQNTGSVNMALVVWTCSGIFSMIGAYCFAELGCMVRKSGADYAYIMAALGRFPAFIRMWVEVIVIMPATIAIVALTFSVYALKPFFPECSPADGAVIDPVKILAALCICKLCRDLTTISGTLAFINCWEVRWATAIQDIFTYAKLLALAIIIVTGLAQISLGKVTMQRLDFNRIFQTENFTFEETEPDVTKVALSFYSGDPSNQQTLQACSLTTVGTISTSS